MKDSQHRLDPDPIAIYGVVISGFALLLALESKIEARRARTEGLRNEQTRRKCRALLSTLRTNCQQLSSFVRSVGSFRHIEPVIQRGDGYGAFRVFLSDAELDTYFEQFDATMKAIGSINKAVVEIPLSEVSMSESERRGILSTIKELRDGANEFIANPTPDRGLAVAATMSRSTVRLVQQIEQVIDLEPPNERMQIQL